MNKARYIILLIWVILLIFIATLFINFGIKTGKISTIYESFYKTTTILIPNITLAIAYFFNKNSIEENNDYNKHASLFAIGLTAVYSLIFISLSIYLFFFATKLNQFEIADTLIYFMGIFSVLVIIPMANLFKNHNSA